MGKITRTPGMIAIEINSIKQQTRNLVLYNSIEIGRRLAEAKLLVHHGEWGDWLKKSVDYSQSTANNLMRIFEEYGASQITLLGDNAKSQALGNLSYTQAVALLGVSEEEREKFIQDHPVDKMSTRELQEAIKARKEAEKRASDLKSDLQAEQLKNKQLSIDLKSERQRLTSEVARLTALLEAAKNNDSSPDQVEQLQAELKTAQEQVKELTERISQPVTLEPVVVEKVPKELEQELAELRAKNQELEAKTGGQANPAVIKYSVCFEALIGGFQKLLGALAEIKETDETAHEKYKKAVLGLINKMAETL
ncbi:DUF3102 domain-containing protein [Sporomusa acidovorans]|uniref:Chromosome partition protein Smc n=1 Tax=Sporomusa acidovorans (strain ATCC 49682 / DSM 3132 / Mol) TaxID=1123286 RepID=A0ABZ3J937_SPOA4|nr:DUF3102 domain-containing protein [Sporomusa acidovorans]OZC16036.1 hypothetical protein SPACI_44020 [Sporomusa acidovorans DSM 3132]SDD88953.1 Protein of unknown function [Sporomusa acidovorans]